MGFSVAAAYATLFAATLFFLSLIVPTVNDVALNVIDDVGSSYDGNNGRAETTLQLYALSYNKTTNILSLSIENTGETVLDPRKTEALLNGVRVTENITSKAVEGSSTAIWAHGELMTLEIDLTAVGLDYKNITARHHAASATNLTAPGHISVYDRIYVEDNNAHIDVFDLDGTFKYTIAIGGISPGDLSVVNGMIYYINNDQNVYRMNLDGTGNTELISNADLSNPTSIFAGDSLYVVDANSQLYRYNLDGTGKTLLTATHAPYDVYVSEYIYLLNNTGASAEVVRCDADGTNPTTLVSSAQLSNPTALAVSDDDFPATQGKLYVADNDAIDVFTLTGTTFATFDEKLSNNIFGIDVRDRIYVTDEVNDLNIFKLGSSAKLVVENGKTITLTI